MPISPAWAKFHNFSTFNVRAKATVNSTKYDDIAIPVQRICNKMTGSVMVLRWGSGDRVEQGELPVLHHVQVDRLVDPVVGGHHQLAGHRQVEGPDLQQCLAHVVTCP